MSRETLPLDTPAASVPFSVGIQRPALAST